VESAAVAALGVLNQHGAQVSDAALPDGPYEDAANVIIAVEGVSAFQSLITSGRVTELSDPLGKVACYVNDEISASDYLRAMRVRRALRKKVTELYQRFDVLAAASLPIAATPLEMNLETELSFPDPLGGIGNLYGLPALSVPCGFTDKKLPVGVQFVAQAGNDSTVIAAGRLFQQHTDWHKKRPPIG